jgi:hypothetical protein
MVGVAKLQGQWNPQLYKDIGDIFSSNENGLSNVAKAALLQ